MKQFLKYVGQYISSYPTITLTTADKSRISEKVVESLGLKDINRLRDRFEGQAFLDKSIRLYGALIACQKCLALPISDISLIDFKGFKPELQFNGCIYQLNIFQFGELPTLPSKIENSIFIIQKDTLTFIMCGFANAKIIADNIGINSNVSVKSSGLFLGFEKLSPIDSLAEHDQLYPTKS